MNSRTEVMSMEAAAVTSTLRQHLFTICYLAAIAIATVGWLSALGWVAVRLENGFFA
jgi:hypothetical protein